MTLYPPTGNSILPREDYDAIVAICREQRVQTALEFGPGLTTLALFEAGVGYVESFEHDRMWRKRVHQRCDPYIPAGTSWRVRHYEAQLSKIPRPFLARAYDLGIVDSPQGGDNWKGPHGTEGFSRLVTLDYALKHCKCVLLHDAQRPGERASLQRLGCSWTMLTAKLAMVGKS